MNSYALKFIMLGDSRVGKSQLSRSFTNKPFQTDAPLTLNVEFSTRTLEFEKCCIRAQVWDTAGQERFAKVTRAYYRDAVGAAVVFDITDKKSFADVKAVWLNELKQYGHEGMRLILVGNKLDLVQGGHRLREVEVEEALAFAKSENLDYVETSALTGAGVEGMFRRMIFSVAKLIPDVQNNLDIAAIPEGWIIKLPTAEKPGDHDAEGRSRAVSDDASTTMETAVSVSSFVAAKSPRSLDSRMKSVERRKSTMLRLQYLNYWTGEYQNTLPQGPAVPSLLHAANPPPVSRRSSKVDAKDASDKKKRVSTASGKGVDMLSDEPVQESSLDNSNSRTKTDSNDSLSEFSSRRKSLVREDSMKERDSNLARTERSSSLKTIEVKDVERRKVRKCASCIIL